MFRAGRQKRSAREAAQALRDAEHQALLAALAARPDTVCPFLGLASNRAEFQPESNDDHRCYAFGDAAPLSHEQQSRVCLQRGYGNCPRYLRGLLVIPTEEMEAIRRRKVDFPTDVARDIPTPAVTPAMEPVAAAEPAAPEPAPPAAAPQPVADTPEPVQAQQPEPEPAPEREPEPEVAAVPVAAPVAVAAPPKRIAPAKKQKPKAAAKASRPRKPATPAQVVALRRRRFWRTGTVALAAAIVALSLVSVGGLMALTQRDQAALVEPSTSGAPTEPPEATATADPTAEPSPTRTPAPTRTAAPTRTPRASATPAPGDDNWFYVIRDGDSISSLAIRYGTTTDRLLDMNPEYRTNPDLVIEGQRVEMPCTAIAEDEGRCP